jgi:hypothetical protein
MGRKIFVAGPFNGVSEEEKQGRVNSIKLYCVKLFSEGDTPISALLMGLTFADIGGLPTNTEMWMEYCEKMLNGCDELHVLMLDGWEKSTGVAAEIEIAKRLGIEIKYINLN